MYILIQSIVTEPIIFAKKLRIQKNIFKNGLYSIEAYIMSGI